MTSLNAVYRSLLIINPDLSPDTKPGEKRAPRKWVRSVMLGSMGMRMGRGREGREEQTIYVRSNIVRYDAIVGMYTTSVLLVSHFEASISVSQHVLFHRTVGEACSQTRWKDSADRTLYIPAMAWHQILLLCFSLQSYREEEISRSVSASSFLPISSNDDLARSFFHVNSETFLFFLGRARYSSLKVWGVINHSCVKTWSCRQITNLHMSWT